VIRFLLVLTGLLSLFSALATIAHAEPRALSASVTSHHADPVWFEWDAWQEEDRILNPAYVQTTREVVIVAPHAEPRCTVRLLVQGSGTVRTCEVPK
jgi:hypothetical protein